MANKVEFGLSQIHVGTFTAATDGTVTMGTPIALPGAVTMTLEPQGDENTFYADNVKYWSQYQDNGFSGSLEVARFTDEFKKAFLNYAETTGGGLAAVKGGSKPSVYIAFQSEGDAESRRGILYNVALSGINREYKTSEDATEPVTESVNITVTGDNATGITMASYGKDAEGYATLFSAPPVPALKA